MKKVLSSAMAAALFVSYAAYKPEKRGNTAKTNGMQEKDKNGAYGEKAQKSRKEKKNP